MASTEGKAPTQEPTPEQKLLHAAVQGRISDMEALLDSGVSIECKDRFGQTPLYMSVQNAHIDACEFLIKRGARLDNKDEFGRTPLDLAIQMVPPSMIELTEPPEGHPPCRALTVYNMLKAA
jgi:ankyrin repeat protein